MELTPVPALLKDMWVAEWSPSQRQFHIQKVSHMLSTNLASMAKRVPIDYFPFAFCADMEQANEICEQAMALQRKTPRYEGPPGDNQPAAPPD